MHFRFQLAVVLSLALSLLTVQAVPLKTKVTLDPDTLRQVIEKLRATSEASVAPAVPVVETGDTEIVFQDDDSNFLFGTRSQQKKLASSVTSGAGHDGLVFNDDLPQAETSAPGTSRSASSASHKCPNPKHRYHLESGACYPIGRIGAPCGENMLFYANDNDVIYGTCDCNEISDVPLVFHPDTKKCYEIYQKAYCSNNEWLVFDSSDNPICEPEKCPAGKVFFHERCVTLNEADKDCKKSERILFRDGDLTPSCGESNADSFSNLSGPKLKCRPGSSQDIVGKCRQNIKFNING